MALAMDVPTVPPVTTTAGLGRLTSRLFNYNSLDEDDKLDKDMIKVASELSTKMATLTETERNNFLQAQASIGPDKLSELQLGLLYTVLSDPVQSAVYARYISFITRDGYSFVVSKIKYFIGPKFSQLLKSTKDQLVWFTGFLIEGSANESDHLLLSLLRQVKGGDTSADNVALAHGLVDLITRHRVWVEKSPLLVASVWYHITRFITDHSKFPALRQLEVDLSVRLITSKFQECMMIGRDLVRLLQDVSRLPAFRAVWEAILTNPSSLSPTFTGLTQIFSQPTPKRFLLSRITPLIEEQLMFIMENVRMGNQKRYQQWFMDEHLSGPDSESIICDLVRFICCVYHPTNAILASDRVQRWTIIGWLLKCTKTNYMASSVKLCLFYDWMFFNPGADSIMNIEPAMLVMQHSLPRYKNITTTLLDFLLHIRTHFHVPMVDVITNNLRTSIHALVSKGVVSSILPTFASEHIDPDLRARLADAFPQHLQQQQQSQTPANGQVAGFRPDTTAGQSGQPPSPLMSNATLATEKIEGVADPEHMDVSVRNLPTSLNLGGAASSLPTRTMSDDLAPAADGKGPSKSVTQLVEPTTKLVPLTSGNSASQLAALMSVLRAEFVRTNAANTDPGPLLDRYLDAGGSVTALTSWSAADELSQDLARFLLNCYEDEFRWEMGGALEGLGEGPLLRSLMQRLATVASLSQHTTSGSLPTTTKRPGVATSTASTNATKRARLIRLFAALRSQRAHPDLKDPLNDVGPILLVATTKHLNTINSWPLKQAASSFVNEIYGSQPLTAGSDPTCESQRPNTLLEQDIMYIHEKNTSLFHDLLPVWFSIFGSTLAGRADVLHLALSTMDFSQSLHLANFTSAKNIVVVGKAEQVAALTEQSLQWETFEQLCFWQLVCAEYNSPVPINQLLLQLGDLKFSYSDHSEAYNGLLVLLRGLPPDPLVVQFVLLQSFEAIPWIHAALCMWEARFPKRLLKTLVALIYQVADQLEGVPLSRTMEPGATEDDLMINGSVDSVCGSWRRHLEGECKELALHLWKIAKSLCVDEGGLVISTSAPHQFQLVDHANFGTALKRLLGILHMDEEFSFSHYMKIIKDQEDSFAAREEEALRQERAPMPELSSSSPKRKKPHMKNSKPTAPQAEASKPISAPQAPAPTATKKTRHPLGVPRPVRNRRPPKRGQAYHDDADDDNFVTNDDSGEEENTDKRQDGERNSAPEGSDDAEDYDDDESNPSDTSEDDIDDVQDDDEDYEESQRRPKASKTRASSRKRRPAANVSKAAPAPKRAPTHAVASSATTAHDGHEHTPSAPVVGSSTKRRRAVDSDSE